MQAISLAHFSLTFARGVAANRINTRMRLQAEVDRNRQENVLLVEDLRIKDARMERIPPERRPHDPPTERLAILELRAARAWSLTETAGWITFSSAGADPYRVATSWGRAVPAGRPSLTADKAGGNDVLLSWTGLSGATSYDVVQVGVSDLLNSNGSFQSATQVCIANTTDTSFTTGGTPSAGDGYWFLVRGQNCGGTWNR